jgi:hypothetical protein
VIPWWHLLWIVPAAMFLGFFIAALFCRADDPEVDASHMHDLVRKGKVGGL